MDLRGAFGRMQGPSPHPSPSGLQAYLKGDRSPALEDHLAACPGCRTLLAGLHRRRKFLRWIPVAAALLLSAGLWGLRPDPAPSAPSAPPASDTEIQSGSSILLSLRPGGRLEREGGTWLLKQGRLRAESPGEPCRLRIGSLQVELLEGTLLAAFEPSSGPSLLSEASADEGNARITLLEGRARIDGNDAAAPFSLGSPLAWTDDGWRPLGPDLSLRNEARTFLAPPGRSYVFEALVRKAQGSAELGLFFEGRELPLGANLLPAGGGWSRIRLSWSPGLCRAALGERELVSVGPEKLGVTLSHSGASGTGLRAWGGAVEVRQARWRPEP